MSASYPQEITLAGDLWLASDIHMSAAAPRTTQAFLDWLALASREARAVVLPGDIFDAWIGDDVATAPPPWLDAILRSLQQAAAATELWLGRGNRDFLLGQRLADQVGAHLLPEQVVLNTDAGKILIAHGDEYCTDDLAYQEFRKTVRNPAWQQEFLSKSIAERLQMAAQAREASQRTTQATSAEIMDVNAQAIEQAFHALPVLFLVHGHTHRPGRHVLMVDGIKRERWVLPDWDLDHGDTPRGGWMVIDQDGLHTYELDDNNVK